MIKSNKNIVVLFITLLIFDFFEVNLTDRLVSDKANDLSKDNYSVDPIFLTQSSIKSASKNANKLTFENKGNFLLKQLLNTTNNNNNEDNIDLVLASGNCNNLTCINGKCLNNTTCECFIGYDHFPKTNPDLCNYKNFSQVTAFFLELFFILGFGHLYCERTLNFYVKILTIGFLIMLDFLLKYYVTNEKYFKKFVFYLSDIFYFVIFSWQLIDLVFFSLAYYKDGNGIPLSLNF